MEWSIFDLGSIDFLALETFQRDTFHKIDTKLIPRALIFAHPYPVITLGRQAKEDNILISPGQMRERGINCYRITRGGDVTYHGPGQLLCYPLVHLAFFKRDIHFFLRYLEQLIIAVLGQYGIRAYQRNGLTGVWVNDQKIASIGIAVRRWISYYGFALNVKKDDLANFSLIRPCGMNIMITSMESVLGRQVHIHELKEALIRRVQND